VVGYDPFSLCVIHKEGLCTSCGDNNGLVMIIKGLVFLTPQTICDWTSINLGINSHGCSISYSSIILIKRATPSRIKHDCFIGIGTFEIKYNYFWFSNNLLFPPLSQFIWGQYCKSFLSFSISRHFITYFHPYPVSYSQAVFSSSSFHIMFIIILVTCFSLSSSHRSFVVKVK
jgi:hypothetical protein